MSRDDKMKRHGNLYDAICSVENLKQAALKAARGKNRHREVERFMADADNKTESLRRSLLSGDYMTSEYRSLTIYEPKKREIDSPPYYPDQVVDHAIVQVCGPIWLATLTDDTYACIPGRGLHLANTRIRKALKTDPEGTRYALLTDVRKFYASVDHDILKGILRRKIKCGGTLRLLDEIIDSHSGLPIGRYLSPYMANLYLSGIDHAVKERFKVRHYYRYNDNMLFLSSTKDELHDVLDELRNMLNDRRLTLNGSWQIFPVEKRGIDFTGYVYYRDHTRLRKSIKQRIFRRRMMSPESFAAYRGWLKWCDGANLTKKIIEKYGIE